MTKAELIDRLAERIQLTELGPDISRLPWASLSEERRWWYCQRATDLLPVIVEGVAGWHESFGGSSAQWIADKWREEMSSECGERGLRASASRGGGGAP